MAKVVLGLSDKVPGALKFYSEDPYLASAFPSGTLTDDFHIVNTDKAVQICDTLAAFSELTVTDEAMGVLAKITNEDMPESTHFHPPFEGFQWKKFQKRCINWLAPQDRCMVNLGCGCGKTFVGTLLACKMIDRGVASRILVVCPDTLTPDWVKNFQTVTDFSVSMVKDGWGPDKRKQFYMEDTSDVLVINYEKLRTADAVTIDKRFKKDGVIVLCDELHKCRNRTSAIHRELRKTINHCAKGVIGLTATPIVKAPENYYNEFRLIDPNIFGGVKEFEHNFTLYDGEKDAWRNYVGYQNLDMMHVKTFNEVFVADKSNPEIAKEFPAKNEILLEIELSRAERVVYDEIAAYGCSMSKEDRQGAAFRLAYMRLCNMPEVLLRPMNFPPGDYGEQAAVIDSICRKHASKLEGSKNSTKLALVKEKVAEIIGSGEKMIVFAAYTENCLFPLAKHLSGFEPLMICGGMPDAEREESKRLFKTSKDRNLLLMSDAGQVGLNFQQAGYVLHYQTPPSHADYTQRSDRVHRLDSGFSSVDIYRIVTHGTIEDRIEDTMLGRKAMSKSMGFGEYEELGTISEADEDWFCGF